jgi:ribonuclease G
MRHLGVSRRIEDEAERERLRGVLEELREGDYGLIVRTVGEGRGRDELAADRDYLATLWRRILESAARVRAPTLVHRDLDLALRVVRDLFNEEFSVLWVDGEETYQRILEFLDQVQPTLTARVKLEGREGALFDRFDIDQDIESALGTKVWLKSGGYLVINQTEALVAIDVNTGRYVGKSSLEETVLATNLEAVREMVRQIRLRDLSGILIVDLIDMSEQEHRDRVFAALEEELKKDRAKSKVLQISEFGVVEITRKRSHANLERSLTRSCPYCKGSGRIKTTSTICLQIRAEVLRRIRRGTSARELLLRVHPEVSAALQNGESAILEELERAVGSAILLRSDPDLHRERFDLSEL